MSFTPALPGTPSEASSRLKKPKIAKNCISNAGSAYLFNQLHNSELFGYYRKNNIRQYTYTVSLSRERMRVQVIATTTRKSSRREPELLFFPY